MATQLAEDYPDTFALIAVHKSDAYATPWGDSRFDFYSNVFAGYPTFVYDGLSDHWPTGTYEPDFLARQAVATDVILDVSAEQQSGQTFDITTRVCIEVGGMGKSMRIHAVQSLSTYPATEAYHRHTVMQGLAGIDITVAAGACETVTHTITFDADSWALADQMQLTVWAQEAVALGPAEVYQAEQVLWPFNAGSIFTDGFEIGSTVLWTIGGP